MKQTRELTQMSQGILTTARLVNLSEGRLAIVVGLGLVAFAFTSTSGIQALEWAVTASVWTDPTATLRAVSTSYAGLGALLLLSYLALPIVLTAGAVALGGDARACAVDRRHGDWGNRRAKDQSLRLYSRSERRPSLEPLSLAQCAQQQLFPEVRVCVTCKSEPRSVSLREDLEAVKPPTKVRSVNLAVVVDPSTHRY